MKKVLKVCASFLIIGFMLIFTACKPFDGFDDNDAILKTTSNRLVGASQNYYPSKYELIASKFNGVIRIKDIKISKSPTLTMDLTINSGRFKVVLVKDNDVFLVTGEDVAGSVQMSELSAGTYNLRIVGCDANIFFTFYF